MRDKINKLKTKKYAATIMIGLLLVFVLGLISLLKPAIKNIKINNILSKTSSLNASVVDGVSEGVASNNYDEIKYRIKIDKDKNDTAVIVGKLSKKENKYARFKEIKDSEVSDDGKTITINTTKSRVTVTVIVENAPYGTSINPNFTINSEDENNSNINVEPVTITGKSVEGKVYDEKGTLYKGIELSLIKNNEEIKRTYTKSDGEYVFSLGELDTYQIELAEAKYKIVRFEDKTTDENQRIVNIVIKEVEPFDLNIKKTITKLDLVVNGKKETFEYDNETTVVRSIKNAKTIEGSIYYNISIKNTGEIKGTLTALKDKIPEGLSFDENKNPGWTQDGEYLFYTVLEGTEIDAFGKTSASLILDIVKTNEAKNYINRAIAAGEDFKYVAYYLNNELFREEYVASLEKIEDINPNVKNFAGWYTDKSFTNKYDFDNTVTKDIILYGKIENNKYNVTFVDRNPNNGEEITLGIIEVPEGNSADLIDVPEYKGYKFKCFESNDICYDDDEIIEDTVLYTKYTINNYRITYNLNDGVLEEDNPETYTINDEFTLNKPKKEGHTFLGWTGTDLSEEVKDLTIERGSIGDREYTANFVINKSTLTIDPNGGTYLDNASSVSFVENYGTIKQISPSVKRGYTFKKYNKTGGGIYSNLVYTFDNDDGTLTAEYDIDTYTITYSGLTDAEKTALNNPLTFNVETNSFTLKNPETRVDTAGNPSQDFVGWNDGKGNVSSIVTIEKGSINNRTYTAIWRENEKEYSIGYILHDGQYETGKTNPNTYTRQTETFTLNNPGKTGYTFTGWTIPNSSELLTSVTIQKGSAGNRSYEAHYSVVPYTITYSGLTESEKTALGNPTGYNIETAAFSLKNPTRVGYTFKGWSGTGIADKSIAVTVLQGSTGDRKYTANFEKAEYTITYTLNDGELEQGKTNPTKYSIESDDITLNNPTKAGYKFIGWSGTDLDEIVKNVTIPSGSIGHRSFLANYEPIVYNLTYDYDGGDLEEGDSNPSTYTIETEDISLSSPVKEGYDFTHYTVNNVTITGIPKGSIGDKHLVAHYEIRQYAVNYYNGETLFHTEELDWNTQATKPSTNPTNPHNIFLYWTEDHENEFDFNTYIKENRNLYAVYEEVVAPEISISPTLNADTNRTWVCNNSNNNNCGVTVTISSEHSDYEFYYKIGDGEAIHYEGPFKVYENATITAWSKKSNINSATTNETIDNVDSTGPTINPPGTGAMSFNMTVSGTAQDAESGVKKFTLYVKEKDALVFDDELTYISEEFDGIKDHAENYDHTFYGVKDNTEYIVKIVAEDYVGNTSEREVSVTTHPYVARVVGKNGILWYTLDPITNEIVMEDNKEFLYFDSIQSAVDYCANIQCTIQTNPIAPVVTESVTIGEIQDITIDLDGRTITSSETATFVNNGKLQVVDRNSEKDENDNYTKIGSITNPVNKAIINNGIFTLGEGSSEPSATFIYPELSKPVIEGEQTAIEQNNIFYFFDGKPRSNTLPIISNGQDAITQYSYNAVITGEGDKTIATLKIEDDAEARIRSTYYNKLKVNLGDNAFDSSKTGTMSSESAKMLSKIKQYSDYGFIYDEANNLIYSGNTSTANTTAISYLKIDLTSYEKDQFLMFDTFIDTYNSNTYGYVSISEEFGNTGTQIYKGTGNDKTRTIIHLLEKGKTYYIYFGFVKSSGNISDLEKFVVSNFSLLGEKIETGDISVISDINYYSFEKQDNGKYASINGYGYGGTYAHAYTIFDLRNETSDIDVVVNVSVDTENANDKGWMYLSNNSNYQGMDITTGRIAYIAGKNLDRTYNVTLKHGEINYLHYCYYNYHGYHSGPDHFEINSIYLTKTKGEDIILDSTFSHNSNDTYYFNYTEALPNDWKALVGKNGSVTGATLDETNDAYSFDGNDIVTFSGGVTNTTLTSESVELEFSTTQTSNSVYYMGSNKEKIAIGLWNGTVIVGNNNSNIPNTYQLPSGWTDGNKHKITVVCNNGTYNAYFDNVIMTKTNTGDAFTGGLNDNTYIGGRSSGNYFVGNIYNVKVYNRALTTDEITNTSSNEGLILYLDGSDAKGLSGYISSNNGVNNSRSHSYLTYDLTNIDEDKYLYINTKVSSEEGYDFGYIQVNDSSNYPSNLNASQLKVSGQYDNQSMIVLLKKNTVNYVHFMYTKNNSSSVGDDYFLIKEIRFCNSLDDAYSINSGDYSKIDSIVFEKPAFNTSVDTIEILKDITLDAAIVVPQEKEVILDLNGFTLTSNKNGYVIKNNGKLTIIDSDYTERVNKNVDYKLEQSRLYNEAKTKYLADLAEYQEYAGLCEDCEPSEEYLLDQTMIKTYDFTGEYKDFVVPYTTTYKIQAWGAQGGSTTSGEGGKGAYTEGLIDLEAGDTLYVYVGGQGQTFNGGGTSNNPNGVSYMYGSGASDIRLISGSWDNTESLASRIMVAGAGGGAGNAVVGGAGGELTGIDGGTSDPNYSHGGKGGTQTSGGAGGAGSYNTGANGAFGKGANGISYSSGGGGGYYGGGSSGVNYSSNGSGGGGSSYISGHVGSISVKSGSQITPKDECNEIGKEYECSVNYLGYKFDETVMISGTSEMPTHDGSGTMIGNSGDGYVKIIPLNIDEYKENLEKTYTVKTEPIFKNYLEGIDFGSDIDVDSLTPNSEFDFANIVSEELNGNITSTVDSIILNEEDAVFTLDSGKINVNVNSKQGIVNRGLLYIGTGGVINANNSSTIGIYNETNGDIVSGGGVINAVGSSSIGLLNRSSDTSISNLKIVTTPTNSTGVRNESISDVYYSGLDISGAGTGFVEYSTGNTTISNSNIKSTGSSSIYSASQLIPSSFTIVLSNLYGTADFYASPKIVSINNSTATHIYNAFGDVNINSSQINSINNRGKATINNSTLTGSGTIITNFSSSPERGNTEHISDLVLNNSIVKSTATSAVNVVNNHYHMTIKDTTFTNVNNAKSTVINNSYNYNNATPYLNISGNTTIDSSFGTAVYNTGVFTLGTNEKNIKSEYEYGYTGHQEEFVAPEDGTYKLETWGAAGGEYSGWSYGYSSIFRGGFGAYASGTIYLHEGEKLYIHVGGQGSAGGEVNGSRNYLGAYNGGGRSTGNFVDRPSSYGSGGGATDISLSNEDNTWYYDNGVTLSKRSVESYNQRILVAGGGSSTCYYNSNCYGGYPITEGTLGVGGNNSGGGYYGGNVSGGSSYAANTLTNVVFKTGNEEMPNYTSSGLMKGNIGHGYAKITLISESETDHVNETPTIASTNYGVSGSGRFIYYDGTIEANNALNTSIEKVPNGYDIYKFVTTPQKVVLVANDNSRPVASGEEEFVAAINNAKYTTIQNAVDAANNGDEIDILVDIYQQNIINIPNDKQVTIDYNGHTVNTHSSEYLFNNTGNLTVKDSLNNKPANIFYGKEYINNTGTMNLNNIYIKDNFNSTRLFENNGIMNISDTRLDIGSDSSYSGRTAVLNKENGVMNLSSNVLKLNYKNNFIENNGILTFANNALTDFHGYYAILNNSTGNATVSGNTYSMTGDDWYGRYFIVNRSGKVTLQDTTVNIGRIENSGEMTLINNTLPAGTLYNISTGLLKVNSGTYNNTLNIAGTGQTIDASDNLYSLIIKGGTFNTTLGISSSGISNIEGGTFNVSSGYAINNSGIGIINLGVKDGAVLDKDNTVPKITGKTYGIYTSNAGLEVNFYDGIIKGQKAYNVTIDDIETGYSVHLDYDDVNDIETKYLTNEPMFRNVTQDVEYSSVSELNSKISNGLINNNDLIEVTRDITITKSTDPITIPSGMKLVFDLNDMTIDKNNQKMFVINGELEILNSNISLDSSKGLIDSTIGIIFENNGILKVSSGNYTSERGVQTTSLIKNNEDANLYITGGTFTKYYDKEDYRESNSGEIINNSGTAAVSGGKFYANGSFVIEYYYRNVNGANKRSYIYTSAVFVNNSTGVLTVTGGDYDGIVSKVWNDNTGYTNDTTMNKGELIYNSGTASFSNITSNNSHIGKNTGTLIFDTVSMPNIGDVNRHSYPNLYNSGTFTINNSVLILASSFGHNTGTLNITDSTIDRRSNGNGYYRTDSDDYYSGYRSSHLIRNASGTINIVDSYLYNKGSGEVFDNRAILNIENSTIEASSNTAINSYSTTVNVKKNSIVSSITGQAIYLSGSILNIGESIEIDGTVSKTNPVIRGKTYGINNSNSTINFYDGIIMGETNPVNGTINNVEVGYGPVSGTSDTYKTNYLDKIYVVQNVTQATNEDEKKYYDLKTAFEEANDNDVLKLINNYNNLGIDETAVVDTDVTFDLNGKIIRQSNDVLFTVNDKLTITDNSGTNSGEISSITGSKTFDNYGTIELIGGKITTSHGNLLFKNNSGSTLTIKDAGIVNSTTNSLLIDNEGTLNVYNGAYLHNMGSKIITNRNILNIVDLNSDDDQNTSSNLTAPWIYSEGNEPGLTEGETYYTNAAIYSTSGSTTTIYGGIFNNGYTYSTGTPDSTMILYNFGTTTIKNLENYTSFIGYNGGTLNIENSHFYNFKKTALWSMGSLNIKDTVIEVTDTNSYYNNYKIVLANSTLNNVTVVGRDNITMGTTLFFSYGTVNIINSNININNYGGMLMTASGSNCVYNITNTNITTNAPLSGPSNYNLDQVTIQSSGSSLNGSGNYNLTNNTRITSNMDAVNVTGRLNVDNSTRIISTNGSGVVISNNAVVNIGEIGGTPSIDSPYIEGTTYGIYRSSQSSTLNFYDGLIVGKSGPNAIYGGVTDVEGGYETENIVEINPEDPNDKTYKEYLVLGGNSIAVAKVGIYTFTTNSSIGSARALQNAINFAIGDGSNVKDIDLVGYVDLVTEEESVVASMPVTINLNGFTITTNSTYTLSSNITLNNGNNLGASVSKLFADVFDLSNTPKDIIIYELSDGSSLDTSTTYKLYKDGEIVALEKVEAGRYKLKGDNERLTPIKGRLYLDNLSKGSYRLLSSDNKSIEFSIDSDGNISGNVTENARNSNNKEAIANSEAELILTIQTGIKKINYLVFIIPAVILIILLMILSRKKIYKKRIY